MKTIIQLIALSIICCFLSCDDDKSNEPPIPPGCKRAGTVCMDGRTTTDIGSDACDQGGGFKEWLCEK